MQAVDQPPKVVVVDNPEKRVRQPRDLLGIVLSLFWLALVLLLAVYAQATTEGVQSDVQNAISPVARFFAVPVAFLEIAVTLGIPTAVIIELAIRKMGRTIADSFIALLFGLILAIFASHAIGTWGSEELIAGFSILTGGQLSLSMPGYVAGICGFLTVAGPKTRRRSVSYSWNLMWGALAIVLILGQVSLTSVFLMIFIGRSAGLTVRYLTGVKSERAYGDQLVEGVRRAGFQPISLIRVKNVSDDEGHLAPTNTVEHLRHEIEQDPSTQAIVKTAKDRVYAMSHGQGTRLDVVVLDGDRQVIGILSRLWRSIRLRGIEGRSAISLRAIAERAALLAYSARSAGVRSPKLLGVSAAGDSMLLIQEHAHRTMSFSDLPPEKVTDAVLADAWRQLRKAHKAGLAHRQLTADMLLVGNAPDGTDQVWLTGWESGDVACGSFQKLLDLSQMLAVLALKVGAQRALDSAVAVLPKEDLIAIGPLLQMVVLPNATRVAARKSKTVLKELREALVISIPDANVEPVRLVRFGARTIVTTVLTMVALFVVMTTLNFNQITEAFSHAQPWWAAGAFLLGLLTWAGGAMTFQAFAPTKLPFSRAFLVQAAASFVAIATPAGIGPAALNLRMLTRRKVSTTLAVATVALVQLAQFIVTILLLVLLSVITGDGGVLRSLPSASVLYAIGIVVLAGVLVFAVPAIRKWIMRKIDPIIQQVWPRLSQLLSEPWPIIYGMLGSVVMTMGYILSFEAALLAFGQEVSLIDLAVIYLVGNTVGSLAPTPGGLGAVEFALITGLTTTVGLGAGVATSVVVLFRGVTYWARIPPGWLAMRYLQKKEEI